MKRIVFASNNQNKLREVRNILTDFEILSLKDLGINIEIEENGTSFEENSLIKAKTIFQSCSLPALADDSGLMVDALHGAPGIFSARYSGLNATDESNNLLLLKNLEGVKNRKSKFVSVISFFDGVNTIQTRGETCGYILENPSGLYGFGYDPLFFSDELNKSFGDADETEKNKVSHRAKALIKMAECLKKIFSNKN